MSARAVQRLLAEKQRALAAQEVEEEVDEVVEEPQRAPARNLFDLLGEEDGKDGENDAAEGEEQESPEITVPDVRAPAPAHENASESGDKKQVGKKKKKKGKGKGQKEPSAVEAEVDQLLQKLEAGVDLTTNGREEGDSRTSSGQAASSSSGKSKLGEYTSTSILGVDLHFMRPEEELRRIFGSKVMKDVERDAEQAGGHFNAGRRKRMGVARRGLKRGGQLVVPMEHWPRWDGGISMECTGTKDGCQFFKYVHASSYLEVQQQYELCVGSHDPNMIAQLLARYPYHIDSLLTLAEVYKQMGEAAMAAELLERALYALECAWHPWFKVTSGTCRLEYSHEPNRPFFHALQRHMQHLGRRGCHRTALEVCKLLLSLDPEGDPLGALFHLDYFALRAEQYAFLTALAEQWDGGDRSLPLLPNYAFSLAVAAFHQEEQQSATSSSQAGGPRAAEATVLLQQALMLHPGVLAKLVDKAPIKVDADWARILKHPCFCRVGLGGPSLEHLVAIYVERHHLLWRAPDLQAFLKQAALAVMEASGTAEGKAALTDWACVRKEAFPAEENVYRHLALAEYTDNVHTLPPDEQPQPLFMGGGPAQGAPEVEVADIEGDNPLMVFLRSLLPWENVGVDLQGQDPQLDPGEGQA